MLASSLGKKYVMALSGAFLMFFVTAHLAGNLLIFLGADWLNAYAEHLEEWPLLLWPARVALLLTVLAHMGCGIRLAIENRRSRPVAYHAQATLRAPISSRTMAFSGLAILFFIAFHLSHFTLGRIHPEFCHLTDAEGRHDVYSMVILSFRYGWTAAFYLAAMACLSLHLSHGFASTFQSLGLSNDRLRGCLQKAGIAYGLIIFLGFSSIPLASLTGWLKPLAGGF